MSTRVRAVGPQEGHSHTHTIIFLHGRGSNCTEFSAEFLESEASGPVDEPRTLLDLFPTIRWIFPSAPVMHASRFECEMSQWFDMWSTEDPNEKPKLQTRGLSDSIDSILNVVEQEEALIPCENIFLAGISQGFAAAFAAYIRGGKGFAGLIGFCTWIPSAALVLISEEQGGTYSMPHNRTGGKSTMPVLIEHSKDDAIVPVAEGRKLYHILKNTLNVTVAYHEYEDGEHWINEPQGVDDMVAFLHNIITGEEPLTG
ncbi:hypothetical protein M426DRAFT_9634 [Hypoxylon sp. CI-4A]|nr:hypothetical protein M426DRAFT_9634 [Hypoxylon sp. CI-4A]